MLLDSQVLLSIKIILALQPLHGIKILLIFFIILFLEFARDLVPPVYQICPTKSTLKQANNIQVRILAVLDHGNKPVN